MSADPQVGLSWQCMATPAGAVAGPSTLDDFAGRWLPAAVPGTAAAAIRAADGSEAALAIDYDQQDWWFRSTFEASGGPWSLDLGGLATLADVWLNGEHLLHSENMFRRYVIDVPDLPGASELLLRFTALAPELARRRPRPRWRTALVRDQNLRWFRTTLLGRMPGWAGQAAPVGPWRPIVLRHREGLQLLRKNIVAMIEGSDGVVDVQLSLNVPAELAGTTATVVVGEVELDVVLQPEIRCQLKVSGASPWWPHTHGEPALYAVSMRSNAGWLDLGHVGFRTVEADVADDGFALVVNGVRLFTRGACWVPLDVVSLNATREQTYAAIRLFRDGGLNMVRIPGTMVYENADFFDACDELGVMVWQDAMIATLDPPDDEGFLAEFDAEFRGAADLLRGHPSLAVLCGGSETEQQPALVGLPAAKRHIGLIEAVIPALVEALLPGIPYVRSSPTGGDLPTRLNEGVTQYFGVGAYLRPLTDVRLAGVRFAGECLAFSVVPEKDTIDEVFGSVSVAGHHPRWKQNVPRDSSAAWDFEDVRDFYVREIFGIDPMLTRYSDPAWALDAGRAAVAHVFETVFGAWRRTASGCAGALVLSARDLWPGAGWGLVDSLGRPKSPWYVLRRLLAPIAVFVSDEGLDGVLLHVVNDSAASISGALTVELYDRAGHRAGTDQVPLEVLARSGSATSISSIIDGFRDVNHAYRFGPATYSALRASFVDDDGTVLAETVHLFSQVQPRVPDVGLAAQAHHRAGEWLLDVSTQELAQWVAIDVPRFRPTEAWFHLAPGTSRQIRLIPEGDPTGIPRGYVRALNSLTETPIIISAIAPGHELGSSIRS